MRGHSSGRGEGRHALLDKGFGFSPGGTSAGTSKIAQ